MKETTENTPACRQAGRAIEVYFVSSQRISFARCCKRYNFVRI